VASSVPNRVRERRLALGLSQLELAAATQLSRQSMSAIEAQRVTPAVDIAMRLAAALDSRVEELFGAEEPGSELSAEVASPEPRGGRVAIARVGGRWVSHGLGSDGLRLRADALVERATARRAQVRLLHPAGDPGANFMLLGCAPGLGVLADRLNSSAGPGRFVWLSRSSTSALQALARAQAHAAGVHLIDAKTGEANVADVKRLVRNQPVVLVTLALWQAGLVTARGNPLKLRSFADLGRRGLRLVVREPGSGARRLLEQGLREAGLGKLLASARVTAAGHLEVAHAISLSAADVGVASRDAAIAFDLDFVPLAEERYDIVLPESALAEPRVQRLGDVLTSTALRRELAALGYDTGQSGARVADLSSA